MKCQQCNTEFEGRFCSNCGVPAQVEIQVGPQAESQEGFSLPNVNEQQPAQDTTPEQPQYQPPPQPPQPQQPQYQSYGDLEMIVGRPPRQGLRGWQIALIVVGAVVALIIMISVLGSIVSGGDKDTSAGVSTPVSTDSSEPETSEERVQHSKDGLMFSLPGYVEHEVKENGFDLYYFEKSVIVMPTVNTKDVVVAGINADPGAHCEAYVNALREGTVSLTYSDDFVNGTPALNIEYMNLTSDNNSIFTRVFLFYNKSGMYSISFAANKKEQLEKYEAEFSELLNTVQIDGEKAEIPGKLAKLVDDYANESQPSSTPPASSKTEDKKPASSKDTPSQAATSSAPVESSKPAQPKEAPASSAPVSGQTTGQKNAIASAKSYLSFSAFSYKSLIGQLEYEKFSNADAVYAVDNCGANWNEQAVKSAKEYLAYSAFSYQGLIGQLEYEKFSKAEAVYAADNCGANWNEQAVKSAKEYLEYSSFSRESLIDQLMFENFTQEQAAYGADQNGY